MKITMRKNFFDRDTQRETLLALEDVIEPVLFVTKGGDYAISQRDGGIDIRFEGKRVFSSTLHAERTRRNKWEFYTDVAGEHRWRCSDANGQVLFASSEGYADVRDAETCARRAGWPG